MTDRNEKAKRVLDNSTKVIAGIGVIAVLFAIWFSIQFAKSKTKKEFDSRQTYFNAIHQNFNKTWAENAYWDSVGTETSSYTSTTGTNPVSFTIATRKETFNDQFNVKTSTTARPDLYKVLNTSIRKTIASSDTTYLAQLSTLCMNPFVLHKMTSSTQHQWGITHKSYFNQKSVITLKYDSYKDKEGISDKVFPKDVFFEDQLPVCLRALKLNDSTAFNVDVLESQLTDGAGNFLIYHAKVSVVMANDLATVTVKLNDNKQNTYTFEAKYPNRLLKFELGNIAFELTK
jgi:hypothetical protein